jgi:peroxiredoxin
MRGKCRVRTRASRIAAGLAACVLIGLIGCGSGTPTAPVPIPASGSDHYGGYGTYAEADIKFLDAAPSQESPATDLLAVPVTTADGRETTLKDLAGDKRLIVVFTRGFSGSICPYCSTQTSRLIANYPEFQKRSTEVVVVYPLKADQDRPRLDEFLKKANENNSAGAKQVPPFPLVVDIGLKAVDLLALRKDLSKPATFIVEPDGSIRFAYVGKSLADRPSVKALLAQLDGGS